MQSPFRALLTILVWGLILEVLTLMYYVSKGAYQAFEFGYTLFLFVVTAASIVIILRREVKAYRRR